MIEYRHQVLQKTRTLEVLESNESINKLLSLKWGREVACTHRTEGMACRGLL